MQVPYSEAILDGLIIVEVSRGVAAAYAGRQLALMGATVVAVEDPAEPSPLRELLPRDGNEDAASPLFMYLSANKQAATCNLVSEEGSKLFGELLAKADILLTDVPLADRNRLRLDADSVAANNPNLVYLSVLPFGAIGEKSSYRAEETNLFHAGGEGYLMPNGLALETFPDRPPIKAYGHFAQFVGGTSAVVAGLAAVFARNDGTGQFVDVSVQDINVALSAFAIQRYGDGVLEQRANRSFRYGGVLECCDGHVEVLTLEQRQWEALVELMGKPEWATSEDLQDPLERGRRGAEINERLRAWAKEQSVDRVVDGGQALGVPIAKYSSPGEVFNAPQPRARQLFAPVEIPDVGVAEMFVAPFLFSGKPPKLKHVMGEPGSDNVPVWCELLGYSQAEVKSWRDSGVL